MNTNRGNNISQTVQITMGGRHAAETAPCLVISHGRDIGRRFTLSKERMTLGRSPEADIVLQDDGVSRQHCCIESMDGQYRIRDLGSRNGTFINASPIQESILPPGGHVQIGQTIFYLAFKNPSEIAFEDNLVQNVATDALTGIANRHTFVWRAAEELSFSRRTAHAVALVMADVDSMELINDRHGQAGGDSVLAGIAKLVAAQKRREDILGRFGGDEFVLMPRGNLTQKTAHLLCERIRKSVAAHAFEHEGQPIAVTLSLGLCYLAAGEDRPIDDVLALADKALSRAKANGRNRIESEILDQAPR